jgi:hypothetical protein
MRPAAEQECLSARGVVHHVGAGASARRRWFDLLPTRAVCRGDMTLEEGRELFLSSDWTKSYLKFFEL